MSYDEFNRLLKIYAECEGATQEKCKACPLWENGMDLCEELTILADEYCES